MSLGKVKTVKGMVEGIAENGCTVFKGIPYAKPPVGELRFRPPVPADAWEGVREAKEFSCMCPQDDRRPGEMYTKEFYSDPDFMPGQSEDCLYLNVWTPAERGDEKLPVAMWIHGGAFLGGFGSELEFGGEAYAKEGVILVTVNYRLGAFGFLCHPLLAEEDGDGVCGNYGILDQIAALAWIRENIAAFGGDPDNITVFGQSAGAMSTQTLLSSPLTKGMIHRAILQSAGGYDNGINRDVAMAEAMEIGVKFMEKLGAGSLAELRGKSAEEIKEATGQVMADAFKGGFGLVFVPVVDGKVLVAGYKASLDQGIQPDIPYMLGSTANDLAVAPDMPENPEKSALHRGCIAWSKNEQRLLRKPSYVYYFKRRLPGDDNGAFHSSELWYMMGTIRRCWRPMEEQDFRLSERMVRYWTNFMKNGDPNGEGLPAWEPCRVDDPEYMVFE